MFCEKILSLSAQAETALSERFREIDEISFKRTAEILDAFREYRVSDAMFAETTGYGYDDNGRDTLDKIYARVFGKESAFVRHNIISGTHAITIALFGLMRPNDMILSITGKPYDTLDEVIGISGGSENNGSLKDFGIKYRQIDLLEFKGENSSEIPADDIIDFQSVKNSISSDVKVVYIQRSKGYANRPTLTISQINEVTHFIRKLTDAFVVVDNCYGEFTEECEPDVDLIIGSLIKNPGGGIAESGGYLAGTKRAIELCSYRFSCPGIGLEGGATLGNTRNMYKGLFLAPHVVAQAIKTASFAAYLFENLGCNVEPKWSTPRSDIIQRLNLGSAEQLCAFCESIQKGSPVDSFVTPIPFDMPGYSDPVIMAAGAFTQGSSIELSADGPLRPPFTAYLQGGLTYESGKLGIMTAAQAFVDRE